MRAAGCAVLTLLGAAAPAAAVVAAAASAAAGRKGHAAAKDAPPDMMGLADWAAAPPPELEGLGVASFPDEALPAPPPPQGASAANVAGRGYRRPTPPRRSAGPGGGAFAPSSASLLSAGRGQAAAPHRTRAAPPAIVQEYDTLADDEGSDPTVVEGQEATTEEDLERERIGDVDRVVAPRKVARRPRKRRLAASQRQATTGKAAATAGAGKEAAGQPAPGEEQMHAQCMSFASFLKTQDIAGPELVRMWLGTCQPAVMAGAASPGYKTMCDGLGAAVSPLVNQPSWSPEEACAGVLRVFREAGIGAS